jgi:hypothetical protein
MRLASAVTSALALLLAASFAAADDNRVSVTVENGRRCVISNGLPDHATGTFPNRGNPHRIAEPNVHLCMPANPVKGAVANRSRGSIGVAVNGVQFRPGTADFYDPGSPRGFSRNPASGWNLEGLGARERLGMDGNNAHVDERGLYHYHGVPEALVMPGGDTLIGWAADGFEIHYDGGNQRSSWQLKPGNRPSGPRGRYDGTYEEDWVHVPGSGTLDECNGGMRDGRFVYYATDNFPFFPRYFWGDISPDFLARPGPPPRDAMGGGHPDDRFRHGGHPPPRRF